MQILEGIFLSWLVGSFLFVPGLLVRWGKWKDWYLSPTISPFAVKRFVYTWMPASMFFVLAPILAFTPADPDTKLDIWAGMGVTGIAIGIVLAFWAPRWAKPAWQRRLEDRYSYAEINTFLPVWQHMDHKEWGRLVGTEEGLKELVEKAGGQYRHDPRLLPTLNQ
jgi:hypothetical protein